MPTRGDGRNVGQRGANVSHFGRLPDGKLTRFGAGTAILLRKWCTFCYTAVSQLARIGPATLYAIYGWCFVRAVVVSRECKREATTALMKRYFEISVP